MSTTPLQRQRVLSSLESAGIAGDDAQALRRISMTLHRWHEMECGTGAGHIERDEFSGLPQWRHASDTGRYCGVPIPDRETGALKRLAGIMARYPDLTPYVQGDPRGCALYIVRPGDVPKGQNIDSYYSYGIAVY